MTQKISARKISDYEWEIGKDAKEGMHVPARIYASEKIFNEMDSQVFEQLTNVATLPGIIRSACCMPDGHSGYGFPIGGVAAMDLEKGVISPGGIGFDINCGMRLITTNLTYEEVKPKLRQLVDELYKQVPSGVGEEAMLKLSREDFKKVMETGSRWCVEKGFGWPEDLEMTEENGCMETDSSKCSQKAVSRGINQVGTLGSGNHYLEVQVAKPENVIDEKIAKQFGVTIPNQITVMVHCGSRGFGHQIATDYLNLFLSVMNTKYGIKIRDRELSCAPFDSKEAQDYFAAMKCAVNMAFANRQMIIHRVRESFATVFGKSAEAMEMKQVYDVCHNIAKIEEHTVDGKRMKVLVHRKGATRSFGPGRNEVPAKYRSVGQPVIIGGSMETGSYLLVGTSEAEQKSFGSTAHGSGRTMSRTEAKSRFRGDVLKKSMEERGIYLRTASLSGLAEEAGAAYKNIDEVIETTHATGLSRKVVRLVPLGNIKG